MKRDPNFIQPGDMQFVPVDPSPDFDPDHNKRVIERTIKHQKKMARLKMNQYIEEGAGERLQAMAQFIKSGTQGSKSTNIKTYFGPKHLAYLRGQQVLETLKRLSNGQEVVMKRNAKKK